MPKNSEIDRLREISDQLSHARQAAHDRMKSLGQSRHDLKDQLDASWERVVQARDEKNAAYERQQSDYEAYRSERDAISAQINDVARSADEEHRMGRECAEASQDAYASGDKESAAMYKSDKEDHYYRRDDFNAEKARLIDIAKSMTPPHSDFHHYKERYDNLMESHGILQAEYREAKAQHEAARAEFDQARARHEAAREAYNEAIAAERAKWHDEKCQECGDTIRINTDWSHPPKFCRACKEKFAKAQETQQKNGNKTLMRLGQQGTFLGKDAKIVHKNGDGKTHIYYGGLIGGADGLGHGHAVVDRNENLEYLREPFQDKKDATINIKRDEDPVKM